MHKNSVNNIITFPWYTLNKVTNFTMEVYTTDNTGCKDEKYKTVYLTTPRYNTYANRAICEGNEELSICQEYVTFKEMSETDFIEKVIEETKIENTNNSDEGENKENEKGLISNIITFVGDNIIYIAGAFVLFIIVIIIINRKKTKKQRELGL